MTEFTAEFIAEQKKLLDGYTTEGVFENPNVDYSIELDILNEYYPNALAEIERQQARIEELEQERRWISVEERFPEESGYYLIAWQTTWGEGELYTIQEYYKKEDEYGFGRVNVKYWQPLPQPPSEGE